MDPNTSKQYTNIPRNDNNPRGIVKVPSLIRVRYVGFWCWKREIHEPYY
jgi:hypothetical protein